MTDPERFRAYEELDREFRAISTCGRGHVGVHHLGYAFRDQWDRRRRVHRRCVVEDCDSLWSELAFTDEQPSTTRGVPGCGCSRRARTQVGVVGGSELAS